MLLLGGKKNLGEASGLPQIGLVIRLARTTRLFLFGNSFFCNRLLSRSFFYWSFLGGFLLNWHSFSPLSLATAKIGENHVNNSLQPVNSSLRKIRQRISFDFRLIFSKRPCRRRSIFVNRARFHRLSRRFPRHSTSDRGLRSHTRASLPPDQEIPRRAF